MQYNIVRVDGQKSVYVAVQKQGGDTNTIAVVNGIKDAFTALRDIPIALTAKVVFDQSLFVKSHLDGDARRQHRIDSHAIMVLVFLGSIRATVGVFLSIPLSAMIIFFALYLGIARSTAWFWSGLALAFSRLIDNSVVVLENIFRHIEHGEMPGNRGRTRRNEVVLPVLAIDFDCRGGVLPGHIPVMALAIFCSRRWRSRWSSHFSPPISSR